MADPNPLLITVQSSAVIGSMVCVLIALGFSMLLLVLRGSRALCAWTVSMWFTAAAAVLTNMVDRDQGVGGPALVGVTLFALTGSVFLLKGMAIHAGRELPLWQPLAVMGGFLGLLVLPSSWMPSWFSAVLVFTVASVVLNGWIAGMLLHRTPPELRLSYRVAASVFGLYVVIGLLSSLAVALQAADGRPQPAGPQMRHVVEFGLDISLAIVHCFAVMLLIVQKMFVDLRERATRDGMTLLLNRASVVAQGEQALARAVAQGQPFSLLIIDLDHFKQINDHWGHLSGDRVLRGFADVLRAAAPAPPFLLGRYGGEEFVVMLPGLDSPAAQELAQRIVDAARVAHVPTAKGKVPYTVSIGVCSAGVDSTLEQVLGQADVALYRAKAAGRDRVCVASSLPAPVSEAGMAVRRPY